MTIVVHCKKNDYDILIDRTTPWGNPFRIGVDGDREEVIDKFLVWVLEQKDPRAIWILQHVHELRGKVIACWCKPYR